MTLTEFTISLFFRDGRTKQMPWLTIGTPPFFVHVDGINLHIMDSDLEKKTASYHEPEK